MTTADDLPDLAPADAQTGPDESVAQVRARGRGLQLLPNPHVVGLAHALLLTPDEIDAVTALGGSLPEDLALHLNGRVRAGVELCNEAFYRYDLRYVDSVAESTRIELADGGVLRSHLGEDPTIKLVMFLPLATDGSAGLGSAEVQVPSFDKHRSLQLGEAVLFPSFVEPIVNLPLGRTLAGLQFLAYGPSFR